MRSLLQIIPAVVTIAAIGTTSSGSQLDELGESVVFLLAAPEAAESQSGTGFLLVDGAAPFLVTAGHVASGLSMASLAVIRGKDGNALQLPMRTLVGTASALEWRYHESADIAVLRLQPEASILSQLESRFVPLQALRTEQSAPEREVGLTIIGFPMALGVSGKFSPLFRETRAASDLLIYPRGDTKKPALFFITQDPSIGGFSGAPVVDTGAPYARGSAMVWRTAKPRLVGIVHGTLSDNTGGKLAAITPAHLLLELVVQQRKRE